MLIVCILLKYILSVLNTTVVPVWFLYDPHRSELNTPTLAYLKVKVGAPCSTPYINFTKKKKSFGLGLLALLLSLIRLPLCFTDGRSEDHSAINDTHLSTPTSESHPSPATPPDTCTHKNIFLSSSLIVQSTSTTNRLWRLTRVHPNMLMCIIVEQRGLLCDRHSDGLKLYRLDVMAGRIAWPLNCRQYPSNRKTSPCCFAPCLENSSPHWPYSLSTLPYQSKSSLYGLLLWSILWCALFKAAGTLVKEPHREIPIP